MCFSDTKVILKFEPVTVLCSLLDKVMANNQWHIGVHERHLIFKGPMQLN